MRPDSSRRRMETPVSTGIRGLDAILHGGHIPGRPVVIRGRSGTGKSLFAIAHVASQAKQPAPAVYLTFDESPETLRIYLKGRGSAEHVRFLDMRMDPSELVSGGAIDLSGMMVRIELAIKETGADKLVLDGVDRLFEQLPASPAIQRDLLQLFEWSRRQELTLIATAGEAPDYETGTAMLDYGSDCLIRLSQKLEEGRMTRELRVIKRRGYSHGTNEYPFLIDENGISVMPVTDIYLDAPAPRKRLGSGIDQLDSMLGGKGFWLNSAIQLSGESGTGKTLFALTNALAACNAGLKVLYFSFEESPSQLIRNASSIGLRLKPYIDQGLLTIESRRVVEYGVEEHIIRFYNLIIDSNPDMVVFDPISAFGDLANSSTFKNMVLRLSHLLKRERVTVLMTELLKNSAQGLSELNISSIADTWIHLHHLHESRELKRFIHVEKSRGSKTSSDIRRIEIGRTGIEILPAEHSQ